jgi:VanZ family protein
LLSYFLIKSNNYFKISFIFIILYASISELIQFFLIYRDGDLVDLFFNYLGIGVIFIKKFFLT